MADFSFLISLVRVSISVECGHVFVNIVIGWLMQWLIGYWTTDVFRPFQVLRQWCACTPRRVCVCVCVMKWTDWISRHWHPASRHDHWVNFSHFTTLHHWFCLTSSLFSKINTPSALCNFRLLRLPISASECRKLCHHAFALNTVYFLFRVHKDNILNTNKRSSLWLAPRQQQHTQWMILINVKRSRSRRLLTKIFLPRALW